MKKNSFITAAIIFVIVVRCIYNKNEYIDYIVALINSISLIFIICTILSDLIKKTNNKIDKSCFPLQIKEREKRNRKIKMLLSASIVAVIFVFVYFKFCCSNLGNDIISICTLGLSILDDDLAKTILNIWKI